MWASTIPYWDGFCISPPVAHGLLYRGIVFTLAEEAQVILLPFHETQDVQPRHSAQW